MRTDICSRDDYATQAAFVDALARCSAFPDDDFALDVPLPTGLLRFRIGTDVLTVLVDAWSIDLEGPDEHVQRIIAAMESNS